MHNHHGVRSEVLGGLSRALDRMLDFDDTTMGDPYLGPKALKRHKTFMLQVLQRRIGVLGGPAKSRRKVAKRHRLQLKAAAELIERGHQLAPATLLLL